MTCSCPGWQRQTSFCLASFCFEGKEGTARYEFEKFTDNFEFEEIKLDNIRRKFYRLNFEEILKEVQKEDRTKTN